MKIKSWSLSALNLYTQCPLKYRYVRIDKREEPPSYALQNGIAVHAKAEYYLRGEIESIPKELIKFSNEFKNLKRMNALPEEAIVLDNQWQIIQDDGAWTCDDAWLRMKIDARIDNYIVDFKTGRHYDDHEDQANLYATALLLNAPEIDSVDVEFWYLNSGEVWSYEFTQLQALESKVKWEEKVKIMHNDEEFKPTKNLWCKYCHFKPECPIYGGSL